MGQSVISKQQKDSKCSSYLQSPKVVREVEPIIIRLLILEFRCYFRPQVNILNFGITPASF